MHPYGAPAKTAAAEDEILTGQETFIMSLDWLVGVALSVVSMLLEAAAHYGVCSWIGW
jgi:hypothetical protein